MVKVHTDSKIAKEVRLSYGKSFYVFITEIRSNERERQFMNVMYAADDNYAEIMGVSLLSLLENNKDIDIIQIYIIEDEISEENRNRLKNIIENYHRNIIFIKKPDIRGMLGVSLKTMRWSDSAYARLFLKEIFGKYTEINKLLYLDCDTLVVGSLVDLWNTNIEDYLGAACLECMSNMHKRIIGAKKTDNYVNTGMLLLNVRKWIDDDIQTLTSEFIKKYKGKTEYVDQGVINGTVSNCFKIISPKYNLTTLAYDFTYEEMQIYRKPQFGYSKEEWESAKADPKVVHFTTSFLSIRPWFEGSRHPYAALWKKFHDKSPWKSIPYRKLENIKIRDKKESIYRMMPRRLAVGAAGVLHAYVKPVLFKMK